MKLLRRYAVSIAFALAGVVIAAVLYRQLPARVPVHWSGAGVVDRWMPKSEGAFLQPLTSLAIVVLLVAVEPANWREPQAGAIHWLYPVIVAIFSGLMLYVTILMLLAGLGVHPGIVVDITAAVGMLFAALGDKFGELPQNRLLGIRFPWTLANREVWSRTHRLHGWLIALAGVGTAAFALITRSPSSPIFGALVMVAFVLLAGVYSFMLSRRLARDHGRAGNGG